MLDGFAHLEGERMRRRFKFIITVLLTACFTTTTRADECRQVTQSEVLSRLGQEDFPMALLSKAHVRDLQDWGDFTECKPTWIEHVTFYLYRDIAHNYPKEWQGLSFMVFNYPSSAARDRAMKKPNIADQRAIESPDNYDVLYYLEPNGTRAFRIERWHGFPID